MADNQGYERERCKKCGKHLDVLFNRENKQAAIESLQGLPWEEKAALVQQAHPCAAQDLQDAVQTWEGVEGVLSLDTPTQIGNGTAAAAVSQDPPVAFAQASQHPPWVAEALLSLSRSTQAMGSAAAVIAPHGPSVATTQPARHILFEGTTSSHLLRAPGLPPTQQLAQPGGAALAPTYAPYSAPNFQAINSQQQPSYTSTYAAAPTMAPPRYGGVYMGSVDNWGATRSTPSTSRRRVYDNSLRLPRDIVELKNAIDGVRKHEGKPVRAELRRALPDHFETNGVLSKQSPLYGYAYDVQLWDEQMWVYLLGKIL